MLRNYSLLKSSGWPFGTMGALHVTNTQTFINGILIANSPIYTLTPGSTYDFSSVQVDSGGSLQISVGSAWVMFGCKGPFTLNGSVIGISGQDSGGTFTAVSPSQDHLSYTIALQAGGDGGHAGYGRNTGTTFSGGNGGSNGFGNGGGGGGGGEANAGPGGDGLSPTTTVGGSGGTGLGGQGGGSGGGGSIFGGTGSGGSSGSS